MGRHKLFYHDAKLVRDTLNSTVEMAQQIHLMECELVERLKVIDQKKFYVRYGYNSLSGFCKFALKFTKTQTQRIVTQVRRTEPMANFLDESHKAQP